MFMAHRSIQHFLEMSR